MKQARYLGLNLRTGCSSRQGALRYIGDHHQKALVALRHTQHHSRQMHVQVLCIKVQLANAYATSHMLLGCVVWSHCFAMQLRLHGAGGNSSSVGKLEALYRASLRWALAAPKSTRGASLYLLAA